MRFGSQRRRRTTHTGNRCSYRQAAHGSTPPFFARRNIPFRDQALASTLFPLTIQRFDGPRSQLRALFELADDSPTEIDRYIETGEVLVARRRAEVVGHVQVIRYGVQWEIKSIAVAGQEQHRGIGTALVRSVLQRAVLEGCIRVVVGTATADIDNLRFYQRLGFRMDRIERDAFSRDRGYTHLDVDGIPLRDRVWFSFDVSSG